MTSLFRATHFITHSYTDYSLVNKWWHYGHEIASHSVTHRNDLKYWEGMTEEEFNAEMERRHAAAVLAEYDLEDRGEVWVQVDKLKAMSRARRKAEAEKAKKDGDE